MTETRAFRDLVLATRNSGKVLELEFLLAPLGCQVHSLSAFDAPEVAETAPTFVENALLKARSAAAACAMAAVADDSGIEVDALDGAPGVISARYAGASATDEENVLKLLGELEKCPDTRRRARFRCVMVFLAHPEDASPVICEGVWEGHIARSARGDHGFGYDPVFVDPGTGCTAAQLSPSKKNELSHRAQAVRAMVRKLRAVRT